MFYEVTVKSDQTQENGSQKNVSEKYLVRNVDLFAEAESKVYSELEPFARDLDVVSISRSKITECINKSSDTGNNFIFKVKYDYITLEEKSGKEKRTKQCVCLYADNIKEAREIVEEWLKSSMCNVDVVHIEKTQILDIYE